jgi:hypothetical protein
MYKWYAQLLVIYITSMHVPGSRLLVIYTLYQGRIFIFPFGGVVNIWGVLLLALAGAWWQRPERPRKKFNKICFLGLHGEI